MLYYLYTLYTCICKHICIYIEFLERCIPNIICSYFKLLRWFLSSLISLFFKFHKINILWKKLTNLQILVLNTRSPDNGITLTTWRFPPEIIFVQLTPNNSLLPRVFIHLRPLNSTLSLNLMSNQQPSVSFSSTFLRIDATCSQADPM